MVSNSHQGPYSQSARALLSYGKRGDSGGEREQEPQECKHESHRRWEEGRSLIRSPPAIHENTEYTWIGKVNLYTDKVSGITRDRQKQPSPWNREFGCLIVRAP